MASSANAAMIEPIKRIRIWESLLVLEIFDFDFADKPMPAAPWRQSQISLATVGWQARFDLRLGDFIEDKRVAGCAIRCEETSGLPAE